MSETLYPVSNIRPCIRDTGVLSGVAMVLVCLIDRIPVSSDTSNMTGLGIAEYARGYAPSWVFVTGCEPTTHDLKELTVNLMASKFSIALETNGLHYQDCMKCMDWITVSPKWWDTDNVDSLVVGIAHEVKFVISNAEELRRSFDFVKRFRIGPAHAICLQPTNMDAELVKLCYNVVIDQGWRLTVPLDKLINIE
jgi:organic radical activating enzyme